MVRILLFILLLYLAYRLYTWLRRLPHKIFGPPPSQRNSSRGTGRVLDEMKPCPHCGTYNPTQIALRDKGLYFCDQRCHEAYLKSQRN